LAIHFPNQIKVRFQILYNIVLKSPKIHVVNTDEGLLRQALDLFKYTDKDWSLTDCISFVVMKREGIDIAYSSDHHFEQAGFHNILKSG
jgi:predicted nucleic acid-binding protein